MRALAALIMREQEHTYYLRYSKPPGAQVGKSEIFTLEHSDLNGFLFAAIGPEPGGMSLSVLSLFGRLGVDPWREAGRLAGLPKEAAGEWLAQAIAGAPSSAWPLPDAKVIAARLIALLPSRAGMAGLPLVRPAGKFRIPRALVPFALGAVGFALAIVLLIQMMTK